MTDGMPLPGTTTAPSRRSCRFGPVVVEYDDRVLTPRSWTLEQSRWAAELADRAAPGPLLELCAGAGHIGLAAAALTDRDLIQVEADPVAAEFALANAARAGRADRVEIRVGRMEHALRPGEQFPIVIADPPYLRRADVGRWPADPVAAIDGGLDGLDVIRTCLQVGVRHLAPQGRMLLQVAGPSQAETVTGLAESHTALEAAGLRVIDDERAILLLQRT